MRTVSSSSAAAGADQPRLRNSESREPDFWIRQRLCAKSGTARAISGSGLQAGALGVVGHLLLNTKCQLESAAALAGSHRRLGSRCDGMQERLQFEAKRLSGSNRRLVEVEAGKTVDEVLRCARLQRCLQLEAGIDGDHKGVAPGIVDGNVATGLKVAQLADAFDGDAGGSEVGDTAGVEFHADVGDIDLAGEDGQADGAQFADRTGSETEYDVEIVDHQVEHNIDIQRAWSKDAEAVRFEEHWPAEILLHGKNSGVEAFQMSRLEDASVTIRKRDHLIGLGEGCRQWLLHQAVNAGREQLGGYGTVMHGGHGDDGSVQCGTGRERRIERGIDGNRIQPYNLVGADGIGLNGSNQLSLRQFVQDAQMIAAEGSGTDDGNADGLGGSGQSVAADDGQATAVEVEKLVDLILRLGCRRAAEAGGGCYWTPEAGRSGNKLQQIEGNILVAARAGDGSFLFHGAFPS